jgi:hypothetical protein
MLSYGAKWNFQERKILPDRSEAVIYTDWMNFQEGSFRQINEASIWKENRTYSSGCAGCQ